MMNIWYRRRVNFDNPNHNVGLPVFTIHGNHDDPAGADNLSAVDVLSSCKLVNYFGKAVRCPASAFSMNPFCAVLHITEHHSV